jgi:hypothetical protein
LNSCPNAGREFFGISDIENGGKTMSNDYGRLDGKIAIVTGGTQGLGATIATLFAERGAAGIVICGRNAAKGEAKAAEIGKATGTKVVYVQADLEQVEDARKVVAACDSAFGRVDALVRRRLPIAARSSIPARSCSTGCLPSTCGRRSS